MITFPIADRTQNTAPDSNAASVWPALFYAIGYLTFVVGFTPTIFLSKADLSPPHNADTALRAAIAVLVFIAPVGLFFRCRPKFAADLVLTLLIILLLASLLNLLVSLTFGTRASGIHSLMWCAGFGALALLFLNALHHGQARARAIGVLAAVVLFVLGGWSILSGTEMTRQANQIAEGGGYRILQRKPTIVFLENPSWWQLRGVYVAGPAAEGTEHPYFYTHATLETYNSAPAHLWSKTYMRFEPVEEPTQPQNESTLGSERPVDFQTD